MLWIFAFLLVLVCGHSFATFEPMPLCDGGYPMAVATDDGFTYTCVKYEQNTCVSGYNIVQVSGVGPSHMDGSCSNTTVGVDVDFYVNNKPGNLCDGGFFDGEKCIEYAPDENMCPQTYNKIAENASVMLRRVDDDIECPAQFNAISVFDNSHKDDIQVSVWGYPYNTVPDTMIALRMCPWGQEMNHLGNCVDLCPWESQNSYMRYLRTSTGVIVPIYATKVTTPSLNFKVENTRCYVNLLPGNKTGNVINLKVGDQTWHVVD